MNQYNWVLLFGLMIFLFNSPMASAKADFGIRLDTVRKTVSITDGSGHLSMRFKYAGGCSMDQLYVNGKNTLATTGSYTAIKQSLVTSTSKINHNLPEIKISDAKMTISNITYGNDSLKVTEQWILTPEKDGIHWDIERKYNKNSVVEELAMPLWNFATLSVWKGGILNNGGMVWCKYLTNKLDVYGVHTDGVTFWNPLSGDALRITSTTDGGKCIASKFYHGNNDEFSFAQYLSDKELQPRYHLNRFVKGKEDVFAPFAVRKGFVKISTFIKYIDYNEEYPAGNLPGIDADAVRELRNTTARYGVVDRNIIGGNGWTTNWKCLHEPFFAQIGLFVDDENYTGNFSATLDQERDLATTKYGRVLSRWHNEPGDELPGTFDLKTGYYETQWGYTMDSQTSYIINTAEQFDLNGDIRWLKGHKLSCENALNWLIKRDVNKNGLFEMMNDTYLEKKCSDWIDVVYASFENAFVNAQMYEALKKWEFCERILGDDQNASFYSGIAAKLKESFNKDIADGGFWSPGKKCYIYWRDKDGTIHGDNIVTPVAFQAIAFGICDDPDRIRIILENIETRTAAEHLFHWPLCFDSFKKEEVEKVNWPFPNYENGDIFPTWGYLGIKSYLMYDKGLALKYIKNILEQYHKDGLSSQRFSRKTQQGIGSDILSGICTTIMALYKDIYGIRPKWNRMGLEPNLSKELNGTRFDYTLRGEKYHIALSENDYQLQSDQYAIRSDHHFGAAMANNRLLFYDCNKEGVSMVISRSTAKKVNLEVTGWKNGEPKWKLSSADDYKFNVSGLEAAHSYRLMINGKSTATPNADVTGKISFRSRCKGNTTYQLVKN